VKQVPTDHALDGVLVEGGPTVFVKSVVTLLSNLLAQCSGVRTLTVAARTLSVVGHLARVGGNQGKGGGVAGWRSLIPL